MVKMRMFTRICVVTGLSLVCMAGGAAGDVTTTVTATVTRNGGTDIQTVNDSDAGVASSVSASDAIWPSGTRCLSYADASQYLGGGTAYAEVNTYDVVLGESAYGSASATSYGVGDMEIIHGSGGSVELQLAFTGEPYLLAAPTEAGSAMTVSVTLSRNGTVVVGGTITIRGDGNHLGSGIFALDKFNIYQDGGGYWNAFYTGPTTISAGYWSINESMDIAFVANAVKWGDAVTNETYPAGGGNTGTVQLVVPEGYSIVPEPATICLLALSGLTLIRRRRTA